MNNDEQNYIIKMPINFEPIRNGLGEEFFYKMKKNQFKVGQYIADTGEEDTFGDMLRRSVLTAINLKKNGISIKDHVCLCTYNQKNSCIPFIASLLLNIKVSSLDPTLSHSDSVHLIRQVKPKIFFVSDNAVDLIENCIKEVELDAEIVVFGTSEGHYSFNDYLIGSDDEINKFVPVQIENVFETAVIFFSSGTTGLPKGVCKNHYALAGNARNLTNFGSFTDVSLSYSSLYWISAVISLVATIFNGAPRLICSKFDPQELWYLIEKFKVETLFLAPTQALAMHKIGRPDNIDTTSLLHFQIGGGPISIDRLLDLRDILPGTYTCQVYGQTEVGGLLTGFNFTNVRDTLLLNYKPSSCGRPVPGIEYKVVNTETHQICGQNERGELYVKSKFVMNGYFNMDSSSAFDEDGWLRTGDIVYYDEDHCFYVMDRTKEMLKYKSWHVAPAALELVISNHPAVKQVVVIGIPDEEDGDHPMAIVVLYDDAADISDKEIENFVEERVDERQKLRAGVKFTNVIPLTATGKIKRKLIRDMVLSGKI